VSQTISITILTLLSPLRKVPEEAEPLPNLAVGAVPLPKLVALRAVKLMPEEAGIVAGGVKVDALISSVAPEGTVIVSPESPMARAVPVAGLTLLVFSSLIIVSYNIVKFPSIVHVTPLATVISP